LRQGAFLGQECPIIDVRRRFADSSSLTKSGVKDREKKWGKAKDEKGRGGETRKEESKEIWLENCCDSLGGE